MNQQDHDLLIEIHQDIKHLVDNFKTHVEKDTIEFRDINGRLKFLEKAFWMSAGSLALVQIVLKFIK